MAEESKAPAQVTVRTSILQVVLRRLRAHAEHLVENAGGGEAAFTKAIEIAEQAIADPSDGSRLAKAAARVVEFIDQGYRAEADRLKNERETWPTGP